MSSKYWTPGRLRLCRLQAAFVRLNDMVRDLVDIKLSSKLGLTSPSLADVWPRWCYDNHNFIRKYRFWNQQPKTTYIDEDIPILDDVDVTFFVYLMRNIDPNCEEIKALWFRIAQ